MIDHADNTSGGNARPRRIADDAVLRDLSQPVAAPDMTRHIMNRLGYMQVPPKVARRHRVRRFSGRIGLVAAAALVMSVGALLHLNGPDARRPADITVPAAIGSDVQQHHQQIDSVIQTIRNLTPEAPPAPQRQEYLPPAPVNDDVNRSSVGPMKWV